MLDPGTIGGLANAAGQTISSIFTGAFQYGIEQQKAMADASKTWSQSFATALQAPWVSVTERAKSSAQAQSLAAQRLMEKENTGFKMEWVLIGAAAIVVLAIIFKK